MESFLIQNTPQHLMNHRKHRKWYTLVNFDLKFSVVVVENRGVPIPVLSMSIQFEYSKIQSTNTEYSLV